MPVLLPALLPTPLSTGTSAEIVQSSPWDVALGGFGFMAHWGPETPFIRRGAQYRSEQVNFSGDPGELALGFWWQRSQDTWAFGAGNPTFDGPGSGDPQIAVGKYFTSSGINPWVPGEISLLKDTDNVATVSSAPSRLVNVVFPATGFTQILAWMRGDGLRLWDNATETTVAGGGGTINDICTDGANIYFTDGSSVKKYDGTSVTTLYTDGGYLIRWAKSRLVLAKDNESLYELSPTASSAALPTAFYTHPLAAWVWTDIIAGPSAIFASGYAGSTSNVFKFILEDTGALPTLSAGIPALELPAGERINSMYPYINSFVALGTSAGVRICPVQDTDIILAPLSFETDYTASFQQFAGFGKFIWTSHASPFEDRDAVVMVRFDLSAETAPGVFAWAYDLEANDDPTGYLAVNSTVSGVAIWRDRPCMYVDDAGVYVEAVSRLVSTGYIISGQMTFGMSDPKVFQRCGFTLTGEGSVGLKTGVDVAEPITQRTTVDAATTNAIEVDLGSRRGAAFAYRLDLTRSALDDETGPTVKSVQIKALPSQAREQQYIVPLRCFDVIENGFGETVYQSTIDTLDEVAEMMRTQEPVVLQFFFGKSMDDWRTLVVQVEDFEFRQMVCEDGWGGVLTVSLRTVIGE